MMLWEDLLNTLRDVWAAFTGTWLSPILVGMVFAYVIAYRVGWWFGF